MSNQLLTHDHSELDATLAATFDALTASDIEQVFYHLDIFWARLAVHIRAENVQLFPTLLHALEKSGAPAGSPSLESAQETIDKLREDHDFLMIELTAAMKSLRDFRRGKSGEDAGEVIAGVQKCLTEVSQRLESHNALEENQVYHWAVELLDEAEQHALGEKIQRELDNLPPRLRKKDK